LDDAIQPVLNLANDDVLALVCSDHGDFMGEYGHWFTHAWKDEEGRYDAMEARHVLRPIFLVSSQLSSRNNSKATILDIAPTVAEWHDIPQLSGWEGVSLL